MTQILDIFKDGFSLAEMSASINMLPNAYSTLTEMKIFPFVPLTSRVVQVEVTNQPLGLLSVRPYGATGPAIGQSNGTLRAFNIPHTPASAVLTPADLQDIRMSGVLASGGGTINFNGQIAAKTAASEINKKLQIARNSFDITMEYRMMSALKGVVSDADGSPIYDLFAEFGITKKTIAFALGTATTDVRAKCVQLKQHVKDNLRGEIMKGVRVLASRSFMAALRSHPNVEKFILNYPNALNPFVAQNSETLVFEGVEFIEYTNTVDGVDAIADGKAHAFPIGTSATFAEYGAPGNFMSTVNTPAQRMYAVQVPRDADRGIDIWMEANLLPMCLRPGCLAELSV